MECNAKPVTNPTAPTVPPAGAGRGNGAGRGRPGRGQPPQPGADSQVGKGRGDGKGGKNEVGKIPRNFKDCKDTQGREVCVKYQSGECTEASEGMCWKGPRVRMHLCATVKSLSKLTLCLSKEHGNKDCPLKPK